MAWKITWGDWRTGDMVPVYSPYIGELRPVAQKFTYGVDGEAGSLELTLAPDHPAFESMMVGDPDSWVEVWNDNVSEDAPMWRGVLAETREPLSADDYGQVEFTFAGELSQLAYADVRRVETDFTGTVGVSAERQAAEWLIGCYNDRVEDGRKITLGEVADLGAGTVHMSDAGTSTVLDKLLDVFVDGLGAYMRLSYGDSVVLDILGRFQDAEGYDIVSSQPIRYGYNILETVRGVSAVSLYTGVKPYGADLGSTEYAGRYFSNFAALTSRPSDWTADFAEYYRVNLFEPVTSEPEGWGMSVADAHEGGFKAWTDYWYWDRVNERFAKLSNVTATRPTFLETASDGRIWLWDCKVDDPYSLTSIDDLMDAVDGYSYTRLSTKPADWDDGGYVMPTVETVHVPFRASEDDALTWEPCAAVTWNQTDATYTQVTTQPKKWAWESASTNYASYYEKKNNIYDPTTGSYTTKYERVAKRKKRVTAQPKKWKDKWTSWWWASSEDSSGYVHVPRYNKAVDCVGGFNESKWNTSYEDCYTRHVNANTGVETFTRYECEWHAMTGTSAWNPSTGSSITVSKANWSKIRGNLWHGTRGKGKKAQGKSSCKNQKWGKYWQVSGGYLYTDKDHKKRERLWYKKPPKTWSSAKSNCWRAAAPRFGLHKVYSEVIPAFSSLTVYKRVEPSFVASKYYAKRAEDVAPYRMDEDPTRSLGGLVYEGWASEPIYTCTHADELPLTIDLMDAAEQAATLATAAKRAGVGSDLAIDGECIWDMDAVAVYGRRIDQADFGDATTFETLMVEALRHLNATSAPTIELDISALDRSPEDDDLDPLLPGTYVQVIDERHGLGTEDAPLLLPLVEVDGIDFADPTAGAVKLGSAEMALTRQRIAAVQAAGTGANVVFSSSVRTQLEAGFNG